MRLHQLVGTMMIGLVSTSTATASPITRAKCRLTPAQAHAAALHYQQRDMRDGNISDYHLSVRTHRQSPNRIDIWGRSYGKDADGEWSWSGPLVIRVRSNGRLTVNWGSWVDDQPYSEPHC